LPLGAPPRREECAPWSIFLSNTEITSTRADLVRAQAHPITCTSTSLFKVEGTASKPLARDVFFHPLDTEFIPLRWAVEEL
jgi:hypothetical protein